jgi:hypothetical protein
LYIYGYIRTYVRSLTSCVIGITPQDDLPDLVQNAVSLLKIPLAFFPSLVRQIALQKVEELNSLALVLSFMPQQREAPASEKARGASWSLLLKWLVKPKLVVKHLKLK